MGIEHSYVFFQAVALLTECVDRNLTRHVAQPTYVTVALLTECVDSTSPLFFVGNLPAKSHSLRSAWIEIYVRTVVFLLAAVALLTECVDRN